MKTSDFYYDLPEALIAQSPLLERSSSRLLCLDKRDGHFYHRQFSDIIEELKMGDVLVRNHTRVLPARLIGQKIGGQALVEVLLLKQVEGQKDPWEALVRPGKRLKVGTEINFSDRMTCRILSETESGRLVQFHYDGVFYEHLYALGKMPLPPYIKENLEDKERYQTVYAKVEGSAAAPTAGLHFTEEVFKALEAKGVIVKDVLLHVGLGTFRPVKVEDVSEHIMHKEYFEIPEDTAEVVNLAKKEGRRIIAVGTTSARALESAASEGTLQAIKGETGIFIYPGYEWQIVDALITNFHLPESTLMMLVSALASKESIMRAYEEAIKEKYRFFSFGDAMFIR